MALDRNNIDVVGLCSYSYGQKCRYACRSGHFFGGKLERTCTDTGRMDQTLPKCSGRLCEKEKKTLHGLLINTDVNLPPNLNPHPID